MHPTAKCLHPGCLKRPTYGIESSRKRERCSEHALRGMVNIDLTRCAEEDCDTRATFGDPVTGRRAFCSKHAPQGTENVERKKCSVEHCLMPPAYWHPGNRKRRFCVDHAEEGMVKLDKKLCPFKGCFVSASYGIAGEKRKFCAAHAEEGMVSIGGRRCAQDDCSKRANYGVAGTNKREFCAQHAERGMVNINSQKTITRKQKNRRARLYGGCPPPPGVIGVHDIRPKPPRFYPHLGGSAHSEGYLPWGMNGGFHDMNNDPLAPMGPFDPWARARFDAAFPTAPGGGSAGLTQEHIPGGASFMFGLGGGGFGLGGTSEHSLARFASGAPGREARIRGVGSAAAAGCGPTGLGSWSIQGVTGSAGNKKKGKKTSKAMPGSTEEDEETEEQGVMSAFSSSSSPGGGGSKRAKVLRPWPERESPPPLLQTSTGWSAWEWRPVVIN
ncbi:unnamed protein product [Scytosiphon promiscuus]